MSKVAFYVSDTIVSLHAIIIQVTYLINYIINYVDVVKHSVCALSNTLSFYFECRP